jgi:cell division transport system ATP-binding protein
MIQFYHVFKSFNKIHALMDINVKIEKGDFVFITGPSGAGKTTLLRLIYGDERPDRGQILVHGINLLTIRKSKIPYLRRHLGIIFQDFKLLNKRTVYENVAFSLKVTGTPPNELKKKTWNALKTVGLTKKQDFAPPRLSGGEQQRVAIARALVNQPPLIVADEPTGNLDRNLTEEIMDIFREINAAGTTVVIATHDRDVMQNTPARIISLDRGRIV